jgi:uncharacterized protein (TIGR02145 family)
MQKNAITCLLLIFIALYSSCSKDDDQDDDTKEIFYFTISAIHKSDSSLVKGGIYRLLDDKGNIISIHTLNDGVIKIEGLPSANYTIEEFVTPSDFASAGQLEQKMFISDTMNYEGVNSFVFHYNNAPAKTIDIDFHSSNDGLMGNYTAVRIGEYYWVNQNFNHVVPEGNVFENSYPVTQKTLDKYMEQIRIDKSLYQLQNIEDFNKYYGRFYSYASTLYMSRYGFIKNEEEETEKGWKLPFPEDYRQLFAMCPFNTSRDQQHTTLNERDVRFALGAKQNDNPLAFDLNSGDQIYKTYWFDTNYTTNMYGFNLMPGGARFNGNTYWCNGIGCYNGMVGDIYHLFYTVYLATASPNSELYVGPVILHDFVDTDVPLSYHYFNVRWCRKLTDSELGYKLYINTDKTDIKRLYVDTPAPEGYTELPYGYLRGFYVQYILNNPNPKVTVKDLMNYSRSVEDNYVTNHKSDNSIIF